MTKRRPDDAGGGISIDDARRLLETQNEELIVQQKQLLAATDQLELINEKLKAVDQMKDDFVSMVVHEIRNPLASVWQAIDVAQELGGGALPERTTHFLEVARRNVQRINRILSDLLDLAKMEANRLDLDLDLVAPAEAMEEARHAYEGDAAQAKVALAVEAGEIPPVLADANRLGQVLANLISNAIKHTPEGGEVRVTAAPAGDRVLFSVADTGKGIAPEFQEVIFERYRQLAAHQGGGKRGTGLGLPISRSLVGLHGGTIGVESQRGKGARFSFTIPGYTVAGRLRSIAPQLAGRPPAAAWRVDVAGDEGARRAALAAVRKLLREGEWIVADPGRGRIWVLAADADAMKQRLDAVGEALASASFARVDLPGAPDADGLAGIIDRD